VAVVGAKGGGGGWQRWRWLRAKVAVVEGKGGSGGGHRWQWWRAQVAVVAGKGGGGGGRRRRREAPQVPCDLEQTALSGGGAGQATLHLTIFAPNCASPSPKRP